MAGADTSPRATPDAPPEKATAGADASATHGAGVAWTAERFFDLLRDLGRLRVISVCGPSVFEAICEAAPYERQGGFLNMITDAYHWHFATTRFGHLRSEDAIHKRSGRRALFFELRETPEETPFLRIYVYRPKDEDFDPDVLARFEAAHEELKDGVAVRRGADS